jgi:hypothetical protein
LALEVDDVLSTIAGHYRAELDIFGRERGGPPRAVAAWLATRYTQATLRDLASHPGLTHPGSVSNLTRKVWTVRKKMPHCHSRYPLVFRCVRYC